VIAGRTMAPLRAMTARARAASGADLSGRVLVDGPRDEVRELADTFNDMLDRLDRAFRAQRQFSAQVSHELRTPLAIIASEADVLLQGAEPAQRPSLERVQASTQRAERIIGALLDLARSGSGDVRRGAVDLDVLTGDVLGQMVNGADWRRLRVDLDLEAAPAHGDGALLERVVTNLLANAAAHNRPDGVVEVRTAVEGEWAVLAITNSLAEPVAAHAATGRPGGRPRAGVGLTVVDAVLTAHGGALEWALTPERDAVTVRALVPRVTAG
jgi:signal transduction histidine kinase